MTRSVSFAFERQIVRLPMTAILPRKKIADADRHSVKYKRIATSIAEVGIVEPLVVSILPGDNSRYLLLDGHLRFAVLQERGQQDAQCLLARDDEAFTYNKRINHLATVQEHFMILRALESGVSEEKLAKALNVDTKVIQRRKVLLDGICPEVVEMWKDKVINPATFNVLRKMRPIRQIEVAELMEIAANWTSSYAKALLAATQQEDLAKPDQPKRIAGLTREQMARMEREMASLNQDFKQIESSYGDDILHLVIATGYLSKLVANAEIERYMSIHHAELLEGFRSIIASASLDQSSLAA